MNQAQALRKSIVEAYAAKLRARRAAALARVIAAGRLA